MKEIITANDAGKILQMNPQSIREHMKRNIFPFNRIGTVVKGKKKSQYLVYTRKLQEQFGIPEELIERRLNG